MTGVAVFCALCALLFLGKNVRVQVPLLQRLYLPSSIVGGLIGLVVVSCLNAWLPADVAKSFDSQYVSVAREVPAFLINVIFATLFLGTKTPKLKTAMRFAFPQLCLGQVMVWGQYVVGLGLAGFCFTKWFNLPAAIGNLLPIGFEGGHGTVGGMKSAFEHYGWSAGFDLGVTIATAGMVVGIVAGMMMIQWAYRRGFVNQVVPFSDRQEYERRGLHLRRHRPDAGKQTVMCDSIDSLAWHIAVVGMSVLIGYAFHRLINARGVPLFPLCMIGGLLLQVGARLIRKDLLIDRGQMERISGASLDFLVVSAVATISLKVVAQNWLPLVILVAAGAAWSVWVVLWLAPKLFRTAWFERAIAEFGMATGVTATGLMLLRTVDPENRTPALMSFGYKQLIQEPIISGVWIALAFAWVYEKGWLPVWIFCVAMLIVWGFLSYLVHRANLRAK